MTAAARQRAWIGLGANLGQPRDALRSALDALAGVAGCSLATVSSLYRTAPIGGGGPDYLNAVAAVDTLLSPGQLLDALQAIEVAHGRERSHANAPRTLDLDLLLHGDAAIRTPRLTLPHPRLHQRAFVLQPLLELAPSLAAPGLGALARWLPATADQRIERLDGPEALRPAAYNPPAVEG